MPYQEESKTPIDIFKGKNGEIYIPLQDMINWLKQQQQITPEVELLHCLIKSLVRLKNEGI